MSGMDLMDLIWRTHHPINKWISAAIACLHG